ncbi:MAG: tripartite tricarboxylate transporter TctB family protein [Rubrivivax sp.]|nr:tripartite tricarboxylate transporter TctB family protein [Rubrivivax sp.]
MSGAPEKRDGSVGVRWPELGVALLLVVLAALVIKDSLRVGTGWGEDGPRSGYFPFYIGLALLLSAGWVALQQLLRWRAHEPFAERAQMMSVWAILWPMAIYIGLIFGLGIYVSSALLIAYFMLRHGKHGVALTTAVALGVPLFFFAVFERWFLVALPKGPLEALFGL